MNPDQREILISIVSHNQGILVHKLLKDIDKKCDHSLIAVILTLNSSEELPFKLNDFSFPIKLINNNRRKGFAANHNQAFGVMKSRYYCVMNPDIRLMSDPFKKLKEFFEDRLTGVAAPLIYNNNNVLEDSVRRLPFPHSLPIRFFRRKNEYTPSGEAVAVDWAAGMFMFFDSKTFLEINGFDEKFYLYCEDIDICSRIWLAGKKVLWITTINVFHQAQRTSRREMQYFFWHISSFIKLFSSGVYYRRLGQKYLGCFNR